MRRSWFTSAVLIVVSLVFCAAGVAQSGTPAPFLNVRIIQVKPDMRAEFEALQKEWATAIAEKGGLPRRDVWQVVRGNTNEYHISTPLQKYADADQVPTAMSTADRTRWLARITKCIASRSMLTIEYQSHLSIPAKPGRNPKLSVLVLHEVARGRDAEWAEFREKEMLPAYQRAGSDGVTFTVRVWVAAAVNGQFRDL